MGRIQRTIGVNTKPRLNKLADINSRLKNFSSVCCNANVILAGFLDFEFERNKPYYFVCLKCRNSCEVKE